MDLDWWAYDHKNVQIELRMRGCITINSLLLTFNCKTTGFSCSVRWKLDEIYSIILKNFYFHFDVPLFFQSFQSI